MIFNDLKTVLRSCDVHFDKDRNCRKCAYNRIACVDCYELLIHDLRNHAEKLYKDNKELIKDIRDMERYKMF